MDEPPLFSWNSRRKVGSRTGSAVLSYSLGRSRALWLTALFTYLEEKRYSRLESFDWL